MTVRSSLSSRADLGIAVLRVLVGLIFVAHGGQKLFVYGFAGVQGAFGQMGIPGAAITGPLVGLVEFFGGLALIFGLLTRLAAFGLSVTMLGALVFVHLKNGFFLPAGSEFALSLLAAVIALALTGAGAFSLDAALLGRRARTA